MEFKGNLPSSEPSQSDWDRVKKLAESDAPIPYDPEDGPYDPNDEAATEAFMTEAEILAGWPEQRVVKAAGVPITEWEKLKTVEDESTRAKKAS